MSYLLVILSVFEPVGLVLNHCLFGLFKHSLFLQMLAVRCFMLALYQLSHFQIYFHEKDRTITMSLELTTSDQFYDADFNKKARDLIVEAARGLALHDVRVTSILGSHTIVFRDDVVGGSKGYDTAKIRASTEAGLSNARVVICAYRDSNNPNEFVGAARAMPT